MAVGSRKIALRLEATIAWSIVLVYVLVSSLPIIWMFLTAVRPAADTNIIPIKYWPSKFTLYHMRQVIHMFALDRWMLNTLIVSSVTTVVCLALGIPAAYGLSRARFRWATILLMGILSFRLFPPMSMIPAYYFIFHKLGLLDRLFSLVIVNCYIQLPITIWLIRGFFLSIPPDLEDAARIDGCTYFGAFRRVIIYLIMPGLAAAAILCFLLTWNEFEFAATLAGTSDDTVLISVGVYQFVGDIGVAWHRMAAVGMVAGIPALIFVLAFQKFIIRGLLVGSVKG